MKIGGFQSVTLSDFPGYTAAVVFTQGCNYRCPFCHNGTLLDADVRPCRLLDAEELLIALERRRKILDGLVITGGEPTIQPDLLPFIRAVRKMGYKIKLDTNGSRPEVIDRLIKSNALDYIAMDIKAPLHKYHRLTAVHVEADTICKSIAVISRSNVVSEFRTTYVPSLLTEKDVESIRSLVPPGSVLKIQNFIPENALDSSLRSMRGSEQGDSRLTHADLLM